LPMELPANRVHVAVESGELGDVLRQALPMFYW
jgi:hypothetical protein